MNTKILMSASAVVLGLAGIFLSFFPLEVSAHLGLNQSAVIVLQILGSLYLGFAMLNWTAKANLIGGIYSRPVAIGNFTHFMISAIALIKISFIGSGFTYIWIAALLYSIFAILFAYVLFTHPGPGK
ncbi:hypothetical protein [Daejeonella oryzae]|uniref:hypothetical protein n=1 Tax=Daejeonella oryzae TaxID=1122943 RepID=UPI00040AFA7D|nr:hypothetical protein [Daejeonella oryzae]